MPKVLIAEDDFMIAEMLEEAVSEGGYQVCGIASEVSEVVTLGEQHRPDLAIIDLRLGGGGDGIEAATELSHRVKLGILYATGNCHRVPRNAAACGRGLFKQAIHKARRSSGIEDRRGDYPDRPGAAASTTAIASTPSAISNELRDFLAA